MKRTIPFLWLALALSAISACRPEAAEDSGARFKDLAGRYLAWRLEALPEWATALGDHRFDGKLRDMSAAGIMGRAEKSLAFAAELRAIDASGLGLEDRIDREILLNQLAVDAFHDEEFQSWRRDPLLYTNLASDAVYDLLKREYAPLEDRLRSAIARMQALPSLLEQARLNLDSPSRIKTEIAIGQTEGALNLFRVVLNGAAEGSAVADEVREASETAASAVESYLSWLKSDLLPRAVDEWRLGPELYDRAFRLTGGSTREPLEVLGRAEADFETTLEAIRGIAVKNWEVFQPGRLRPADPDEAVRRVYEAMAADHPVPEDFIPALQRAADDLKRFIREKHILDLPEPDTLTIRPTPDFQAGLFHGQLDQSPPLAGDAAAVYTTSGSRPLPGPDGAARLEGFLREFNGKALIDLIAHEGYPGHYVQGRYAAASPSLVRKIFVDGAYAEGWACYGEAMMLEEGFMDRDPGLELQVLKMRLKVIVNAILDIKLHRGMMGEDEVVALLVDRCFQSEGEAKAKLVRAKGTAVQLSTYYIGFLEMLDLRKDAEAAAGEAFDLAAFHHKVLNAGAPPLRFLRELVLPRA